MMELIYLFINYMEKQLVTVLLTVVTALTTGGAFLDVRLIFPTASHLLLADGLGRFSGTMVSREFTCHGGHVLLSLHLGTSGFDSATATTNGDMSLAAATVLLLSSKSTVCIAPPITMHAMPTKHCLLHFSSLCLRHEIEMN